VVAPDQLTGGDLPSADSPSGEQTLGARLKVLRERAGRSQREVARTLGMSSSFMSQLENGKSQPSIATLYLLAHCLGVTIDELFAVDRLAQAPRPLNPGLGSTADPMLLPVAHLAPAPQVVQDHQLGERTPTALVTRPGERRQLEMDSGVIWEQLADSTGTGLDFVQIVYPARSTSMTDKRMLRHAGREFGYLIEGELEITVGFEAFTLRVGEAIGFDSSLPHQLINKTNRVTRGIWCVRHAY
jgi:transcriptional regulator with XRE-family HTH domain